MITAPNRFDFLRLLFACTVVIYHSVLLPGLDVGGVWERSLAQLAELSIQGFFVISGALVYGSWERSRGVADYTAKRVRRLYPAYVVIILIPAIIALVLALRQAQGDGAGSALMQIGRYISANLVFLNFLEPALPGIFEGQRFPVVNGALWTLKIEVMFYLIVPFLGWVMLRTGRWKWAFLAVLYVGAEIWRAWIPELDIPYAESIARQLPGQMSFFVAGIVLWLSWNEAKSQPGKFGRAGIIVLAISFVPTLEPIRALGLAGIIASIACLPGPRLDVTRWGDISYGVYITHFPIVNALIMLGVFSVSPWLGLGLTAALVIGVSLLLWRFVERPFLRRSSHYRQGETG